MSTPAGLGDLITTGAKGLMGLVIALMVALVVLTVITVRGCDTPEPTPVPVGIDAGPGLAEIDQTEIDARHKAEERLEEIERKRRADLETFDAETRADYERVRRQGPGAVLQWLNDFDRERFGE